MPIYLLSPKKNGSLIFFAILCYLFLNLLSVPVFAEKRVALVIGNADYQDSPLANPVNDAVDMTSALKKLDFEVDSYNNLDRKDMRQAIRVFGDKLKKADVGLFYYAGHGIQIKGRNFLVPLKVDVHSADEVEDESIDAASILRKMESAGNNVNIVILDACRNNPFARSFRSLNQGLARMDGPVGSFIAYATSPGSVAADGVGRNGTYTQFLLEALNKPGLAIEQTFKLVRNAVKEATDGKQIPWESSSLMGEFVFLGDANQAVLPVLKPAPPVISKKYLQVIANVPNAKVLINNVERGLISTQGVLNIDNLTDDQVDVVIQAEGYQLQKQKVRLVANQWKQLNIVLTPNTVKPSSVIESKRPTDTKLCTNDKTAVITTKVEFHSAKGNVKVKRNMPELKILLSQAFKQYGLDFVDLDLNKKQSKRAQNLIIKKHGLDYLIRFYSIVNERPIKIVNTNMKTISGDLSLELIDIKTKKILGSVSQSFNKAGMDKKEILRTALKKVMNKLSVDLVSQFCNR